MGDGRQGHHQALGQADEEGLVEAAELLELGHAGFGFDLDSGFGEGFHQAGADTVGEAVIVRERRSGTEDQTNIDDRVAGGGEGDAGLVVGATVLGGHADGAGVEYGSGRAEPGLVVMLGSVIGEHGVGDGGLQKLGAPAFPFDEEGVEAVHGVGLGEAHEDLGGGRRGAGPGVQKRDADFAFREGLVEHRHVADDDGDEAEADAGFEYDDHAAEVVERHDVAVAESEERDSTEVQVGEDVGHRSGWRLELRSQGPVEDAEGEDQQDSPEGEEQQEREGPEDAQEGLAALGRFDGPGEGAPEGPESTVEHQREAELAAHAAGQDHAFEAVDEDEEDEQATEDDGGDVHSLSSLAFSLAIGPSVALTARI